MPHAIPASPAAAATRKPSAATKRWAKILAHATATFGSESRAIAWLRTPSAPLQDQTPESLLATPKGCMTVEQLLGRIDHGIAA